MNRRFLLPSAVLAVSLSLMLSGCDPTPAPGPSATPSVTTTVDPVDPAPEVPADAVLVVDARVGDFQGAELALRLIVHRSYAWDSPEGQPLAAKMIAGCTGALDDEVFASQLWSFAAIDVSAIQADGTAWPGDPGIPLEYWITLDPSSAFLALADDGFPLEDTTVDPATPHCDRDRFIPGPGSGTLIVGFQGDTDAAGAAGHFTRWANHRYGFSTQIIAGGSSFGGPVTGCTFQVTELGASLGGDADHWVEQNDDTHCITGTGAAEDVDS